ncbi:adenine phosphoribosyltransferase [Streptomyces sp. SAJ15]|nr:adenine phosphoribosyltransferase [Streptomyces sp. SAJ15]
MDGVGMDVTARLRGKIREVADRRRAGVVVRDITPLLADAALFGTLVETMADPYWGMVDVVVGIEARGFILGAPLADRLGAGFVPIRWAGKLPGATLVEDGEPGPGGTRLEIRGDVLSRGRQVLVVDDVFATGRTAAAATALVRRAGGTVAGFTALLDLGLPGALTRLAGVETRFVLTAGPR